MMKEYRILLASELRNVCIENDYYTSGTNADYEKLLSYVQKKSEKHKTITIKDIERITTDIYQHSNTEKIMNKYGYDEKQTIANIAYNVAGACLTFIEVD
jgi:hypothetical protein